MASPRNGRIEVGALVFDTLEDGPEDGELVVLLHGWPQGPQTWSAVLAALASAGYRVVAPAQRGYSVGARPSEVAGYGIELLGLDVLDMASAIGAERFSVVGHDWGGAVAWWLGAEHPERVRTLTSVSTPHPAAMTEVAWRSTQALRSSYVPVFRLPVIPETLLLAGGGAFLRRLLVASGLPAAFASAYVEDMRQPGALSAALNWYRAASPLTLGRLGPVTVPTLYVWSTGDLALGRSAAEATAGHVTGPYRFEALDGIAHWIPEIAPDLLVRPLLEHLRM